MNYITWMIVYGNEYNVTDCIVLRIVKYVWIRQRFCLLNLSTHYFHHNHFSPSQILLASEFILTAAIISMWRSQNGMFTRRASVRTAIVSAAIDCCLALLLCFQQPAWLLWRIFISSRFYFMSFFFLSYFELVNSRGAECVCVMLYVCRRVVVRD